MGIVLPLLLCRWERLLVVCADLVRRSTIRVHADYNKTYSFAAVRHCPMETVVFGFVCQC